MTDEQKVFIRGVEGRGREVIKMLTDLGGENPWKHCGSDPELIYFISPLGVLGAAKDDSETGSMVKEYCREIHLPEQWEDMAVLIDRRNNHNMALYELVEAEPGDLFNTYIRLCDDVIALHTLEVREHFRLATGQEVKKFHELLHKHHKEWDAEKKEIVKWEFFPTLGQKFYYVSWTGNVESAYYRVHTDFEASCFGNCFETEEEAAAAAVRVKKALKEE